MVNLTGNKRVRDLFEKITVVEIIATIANKLIA